MKFHRCIFTYERAVRARTPHRIAAARRAIKREQDAVILVPELARWKTVEERFQDFEDGNTRWTAGFRSHTAENWRRARRQIAALPAVTRRGLLRYWNGNACNIPREGHYLLGLLRDITVRHQSPWQKLRIHRMFELVRAGRLPYATLKTFHAGDPRWLTNWGRIRIRDRIAERTSLRGTALYLIPI